MPLLEDGLSTAQIRSFASGIQQVQANFLLNQCLGLPLNENHMNSRVMNLFDIWVDHQ